MKPNPNWRGDPVWLPDVLTHFGLEVRTLPGWKDWGNGDFGSIWGVVAHHTGANNTSPQFIARNPMLGNRLSSQLHLARDGVVTLCGVGIAWHAGAGSWPGIPTNDANRMTIGIEAVSDGASQWPAEQLDAYHRAAAAILWFLGHDSSHVIGHKEWAGKSQGKWDPGGINMDDFRVRVQHYIDHPPGAQPSEKEAHMEPVQLGGVSADALNDTKLAAQRASAILTAALPSLVNPSQHILPADYLRLIDEATWQNRVLLKAICRTMGIDADQTIHAAVAADREEKH